MTSITAMKPLALLAVMILVSCGETAEPPGASTSIECSIAGAPFARSCTLETRQAEGALAVTLRNARGGFRRLLVPADGTGAMVADGAERLSVTLLGDGRAELSIGGDRYRVPERLPPPVIRP